MGDIDCRKKQQEIVELKETIENYRIDLQRARGKLDSYAKEEERKRGAGVMIRH